VDYAALSDLRIVVGGNAALDEGVALARRAHTSLSGEFFKLQDDAARTALMDAWQNRELPGSALITAHPQSIEQLADIAGPNTRVGHYGELVPSTTPREFIHTKTLARDAETPDAEAWLSTAAFGGSARNDWEVAGVFHGDAARAVQELADSATSHDLQRQHDAIAGARAHGIYATDPMTHDHELGEALTDLVRHEDEHVTVAMKTFFDESFARELAARRAAGVPVDVIAERFDAPSERILREAGANLMIPGKDAPTMHGNVVVARRQQKGYFGTLWASPRGFGRDHVPNKYTGSAVHLPPSEHWVRSRELGVITSGSQAVQDLRSAVDLLQPVPHDFSKAAAKRP
jgi:hypothetical protein